MTDTDQDTGTDQDADTGDLPDTADPDATDVDAVDLEGPWSPRFDPAAEDFYGLPWPLDTRLQDDGRVDLSNFPNSRAGTIRAYAKVVEENVFGFSPMPVTYVQFDQPPRTDAIVPDPVASMDPTSPVQLVRIDGTDCTEHTPILVDFDIEGDSGRSQYAMPNTLRATPVEGFPLEPGETYAFIVTTAFGAEADRETVTPAAFAEVLAGTHADAALNDTYAPLVACLPSLGLDTEAVAMASVFTIGDPTRELALIYDYTRHSSDLEEAVLDDIVVDESLSGRAFVDVAYTGHYQTPIFQEGETPYINTGGAFAMSGDTPLVQRWETVPFLLLVPEGEGPFPVLIWEDGTGWGEWGHTFDEHIQEMLRNGVAVASFMPQFHGTRAVPRSNEESSTYNLTNPDAGRTVLRQESLDIAYFLRLLEGPLSVQPEFALDTDRLVYGGHSQGTQPGSMVAAFSDDFMGYVFSGQSAYFAITVLERKDLLDYESLFATMIGVTSDLDLFHPTLQLLQMGADTVDPYVYATQWTGSELNPDGNHVFVVNGHDDTTTHPIGMAHLTISADLAPIAGYDWDVDTYDLWETEPAALPIAGNRTADTGRSLTHATLLNPDTGHFTLHRRTYAREMVVDFWLDALEDGVPAVSERP